MTTHRTDVSPATSTGDGVEAVALEPQASYLVYVPTWRDYIRRALGYQRRFPDVDQNQKAAAMPGWFKTVVRVHLDIPDRLRLLMSGRAVIEIENRANVSVDTVISDSAVSIISPFDKDWER